MGILLSEYKKALIDEVITNITSNTSQYYAIAANPIGNANGAANNTNDDYSTTFKSDWNMLFGKKLTSTDVVHVIKNNVWTSNSVYDKYDNTSTTLHSNNNFYVVCTPAIPGGAYHIYKCLNNSNSAASTIDPSTIGTPTQATSFQTADGYRWRYISSISNANYEKFAADNYVPVYANNTIVSGASGLAGVETVVIRNGGSGYAAYANGIVRGNPNSTIVQIEDFASENNDFYVNNAIYIYNDIAATSQLKRISSYVSNTSGKWVYLSEAANTTNITPAVTGYIISPRVVFETDGDSQPAAYSVVDSGANSISDIIILDNGSDISWANVSIQSNSSFGSGANLYAIVPPPGGHGSDPASELNVAGIGIAFSFSNTESGTIPAANVLYTKIGLVKNPYVLNVNGSKGARFSANTLDQLVVANVSYTFIKEEIVTGVTSGAKGVVVFANSTQVWMAGDKHFMNGETVANSGGSVVSTITISSIGDIYTKDLKPMYSQNINNVNRSNTQTESFKLIIQV